MQISRRQKHLIILLIAGMILVTLYRHIDPSGEALDQPSRLSESAGNHQRQGAKNQPGPSRDRNNEEIIWSVGTPKRALPVIRGKNKERRYGTPLTRVLPEVIENSQPVALAMIPADGRGSLLPEETDVDTLRSRRMVLNTDALDRIVAGETNHLLAPTPGGEVLDLKVDKILTRSKQTHSLRGKIVGEPLSDFSIVYHDGIIHGSVKRYEDNQFFDYRILPDGHMAVREIDTTTLIENCGNTDDQSNHNCGPNCSHAEADAAAQKAKDLGVEPEPGIEYSTTGWMTIDVVVGYGADAKSSEGGVSQIEARIINSVDDMNEAFLNSEVTNTEMMLLGTIEDPAYTFPGSDSLGMGDELDGLKLSSDGVLDSVTDYSTLLGADLTAFICAESQGSPSTGYVAGLAQRPGRFSVVARTALSPTLTFSHELGHNLGAKHSLGDGNNDNVLNTARYGLRFQGAGGGRYRTIMAYNNQPDYDAPRVPHYSNPNVSYDGTPTGAVDGSDFGNSLHPLFGLVDPVYESLGYDGTNPSLGANNAQMFLVQGDSNGVFYASNRATRAAADITSPISSDSWLAGSTQTITFIGGDMQDTATFELWNGGSLLTAIPGSVDAIDHQFTWTIPVNLAGGSDYQIRMTLTHAVSGSQSVMSQNFTILANTSVTITSPDGGESWRQGEAREITWYSGLGGNVKIELNAGGSYSTIVGSTANDGSYVWSIPSGQATGSNYKIKITSLVNTSKFDESAANFAITDVPAAVASLPFNDSFETYAVGTDIGDWAQSAADQREWQVLDKAVPSRGNSTGPAGAYDGGKYIYMETSSPAVTADQAILTRWFDLTTSVSPQLQFRYHMWGSSMGTLSVEALNDDGSWSELFLQSGDQGDSWLLAIIDLSNYAGKFLQLRITAIRGSSWSSDIAIDDVSLLETDAYLVWAGQGAYEGDANSDGVSNGLAWLLGASSPTSSMSGKLPNSSSSSGNLIVQFSMLNSANRNGAVLRLQYSSDLGMSDPWTSHSIPVPDSTNTVGGVSFVITPSGGMNLVQATIPASQASSGKLFSRLSSEPP